MLNPVKMYKADKSIARKAVTWGPKGKPYKGEKGSMCYRHYNVDWTVHRLIPTVHERGKPGGLRQKTIQTMAKASTGSIHTVTGHKSIKVGKKAVHVPTKIGKKDPETVSEIKEARSHFKHDTKGQLAETSPRWGEGYAPGRRPRHPVPLPSKEQHNFSNKTTHAVTATAAGGGVAALNHRRSSHTGRQSK